MEMLEKVELIREKCNVSYEEARNALETCEGDVLDAIVLLENAQKATERMPKAEQAPEQATIPEAAYELPESPVAEPTVSRDSKVAGVWKRFCAQCKEIWHAGMTQTFVAERKGEQMFALPVAIVVLGLLFWGASLWLLVIGLFLGLRYHIEGEGKVTDGINDAMDKASEVATDIKESIA